MVFPIMERILKAGVWTKKTDVFSGLTYYVNDVTGESAWERPPSAAHVKAVSHQATGQRLWTKKRDACSGYTYYINNATGDAAWYIP